MHDDTAVLVLTDLSAAFDTLYGPCNPVEAPADALRPRRSGIPLTSVASFRQVSFVEVRGDYHPAGSSAVFRKVQYWARFFFLYTAELAGLVELHVLRPTRMLTIR